MGTERKLIDGGSFLAQVIDAKLRIGNTTAVPRFNVRLVFTVAVAEDGLSTTRKDNFYENQNLPASWSASHDCVKEYANLVFHMLRVDFITARRGPKMLHTRCSRAILGPKIGFSPIACKSTNWEALKRGRSRFLPGCYSSLSQTRLTATLSTGILNALISQGIGAPVLALSGNWCVLEARLRFTPRQSVLKSHFRHFRYVECCFAVL